MSRNEELSMESTPTKFDLFLANWGAKNAKKWRMRQQNIFQPPPRIRLCLIQTVKLFLIMGLSSSTIIFFRRLVALIKAENWVDICQESSGNKCCAQDDTGMFFVNYSFFHLLLFFLHCRNGN